MRDARFMKVAAVTLVLGLAGLPTGAFGTCTGPVSLPDHVVIKVEAKRVGIIRNQGGTRETVYDIHLIAIATNQGFAIGSFSQGQESIEYHYDIVKPEGDGHPQEEVVETGLLNPLRVNGISGFLPRNSEATLAYKRVKIPVYSGYYVIRVRLSGRRDGDGRCVDLPIFLGDVSTAQTLIRPPQY